MSKTVVMDHPLIQDKVARLRNEKTSTKEFKELAEEITLLMGFVATQDLQTKETVVQTPLAQAKQNILAQEVVIVPILRAGLGMVSGLNQLIPAAKIGHIGLQRDHETLEPVEYYCKLPPRTAESCIFVVDPMLATGGSASAAITFIKKRGGKRIKFLCLIAAPEGVAVLQEAHPDVEIYCAALDEQLNEKGYILPGLGDAGDRLFGTIE